MGRRTATISLSLVTCDRSIELSCKRRDLSGCRTEKSDTQVSPARFQRSKRLGMQSPGFVYIFCTQKRLFDLATDNGDEIEG
ncbi:hypothetical protein GGR04_003761 [Aureimonas pseudogalii]|uniref:Uncharacterized protein n=1 Tax=Aureimonas pseudogalii TaxID=1744844 RepID=A0A7W6H7A0_9HYPH|nr:hypothetical protein [Aureimonas pseudogalii]